jgi:hypothetical protein
MSPEEVADFVRLGTARGDLEAKAWREALQGQGIEFHTTVPDPIASIALAIRSFEFFVRERDLAAAQGVLHSLGGAGKSGAA